MKKGLLIAVLLSVCAFCSLSFAEAHFATIASTTTTTTMSTTGTDGSTMGSSD